MEILSIEEILKAINGNLIIHGSNSSFQGVCTDSRKIVQNNIFIAIKGENFDGNEYASIASGKGASICIIDTVKFDKKDIKGFTSVILVNDTRKALMDLAKYYRLKLNVKIIGVTGSTGKTSTKDLTAAVLSSKFKVFKTKGNFNNEIGLPLMMFEIDNGYDIAILEMGMSNLGEIHRLAEVANPDIGVITNIGISHIENLKTRENILKAKMEITDFFGESNTLIINGDNDMLYSVKNEAFNIVKTGIEKDFDISAENIELGEAFIAFDVMSKESRNLGRIRVDVPGMHNISNTLLAISCGLALGMDLSSISEGLLNLETTSMRLDIIKGSVFTIIDDSYNASPDSMIAAIDVLSNIKGNKKIAILGTMRELGEEAFNAHKNVGAYAKEKNIDLLITVGEFTHAYEEGYNEKTRFIPCEDTNEACLTAQKVLSSGDILLIKASRSMKFENIVKELKRVNC